MTSRHARPHIHSWHGRTHTWIEGLNSAGYLGTDLPFHPRPRSVGWGANNYPALAQQMNIKGSVKLDVTVLPDGNVKSISVKGGHPLLAQAAQDAIRQWRWQPSDHESIESVEVRFNPQ